MFHFFCLIFRSETRLLIWWDKYFNMARGESLFIGGPLSAWDKQFVWPRDGKKGKAPRSWWRGLRDIMTNTGPDIFVARKNDTTPIKPDQWGNWQASISISSIIYWHLPRDGYDSPEAQLHERRSYNGVYSADRSNRRYDPHTRKYVLWEYDNNYEQDSHKKYPLFTRKEHDWLSRHPHRRMRSKDWTVAGPKVSHADRILKNSPLTVRNIEVWERVQWLLEECISNWREYTRWDPGSRNIPGDQCRAPYGWRVAQPLRQPARALAPTEAWRTQWLAVYREYALYLWAGKEEADVWLWLVWRQKAMRQRWGEVLLSVNWP